ncbi:MAG: polysaccharide lyase family 8 super-sandwich domain-containing protein [Paludibacter sp.]
MKTNIRFFALIVLSFLFGHLHAQTATDYNTMYSRIYSTSFGSGLNSYNLSNQNADGTFVNVTTYPATQPTPNTGAPREHLDEMLKIARAYQTSGSNYHSTTYLNAYLKAWNWWRSYNPSDTNWWWRSIGWPKSLYPSFVLMGRDLKTLSPTDYANMLAYFRNEWTQANINTYTNTPTGANTTDVCNYILASAIVDQDATTINQVVSIITNALSIVTGVTAEGIQPDYGFSQHTNYGRQLYMGNYGKEYSNGIIGFLTLTAGTYFQFADNKVAVLENLFLNGVSWSCFRNILDQNQYGRMPEADSYSTLTSQLSKIIGANTKQKAALQSLYNWMTLSSPANSQNVQTGNQIFWRHDFMVQKGKDYMVSTRMTSTRSVGCESGNGQGLTNYYTGSGVNYLYITGNERYETLTDQNWRRLPGITAPQKPTTTALPLVDWGLNSPNLDAFAGGVSDGKTGACGFIYYKNQTETNLKAYKSYFYFSDYYVALGSGISAGTNYLVPYATTVNQVKYNGSFIVDNEGVATTLSAAQALKPITSDWAYINNVGYQFLINSELNYETATLGTTPIAWIGLNHGNLPSNDQYAYAVYPTITQAALLANIANPPLSIISNTNYIQGVLDKTGNIAQIIFYKAGKVTLPNGLGTCQVNYPAVIQLRWTADSVFVSAANPYCETTPLSSLAVTISGAFCNVGTTNGLDTVLNISMPQNEFQGKSVSLAMKKLTTGLSKNLKNKTGIYPNQTKAGIAVNILTSVPTDSTDLCQIYTLTGKLMNQFLPPNNITIFSAKTDGLSPGIYLLKYRDFVGKLVIN